MHRTAALTALALAACGPQEPATPPPDRVQQHTEAAREAERQVEAAARRMEAEAAAAAGDSAPRP